VTKVSVVAKKICMQQNRCHQVFNKEGFYVRARGLDVENLIKTALIYIVPYFNFGVGALFGGLSSTKTSVATTLVCRPDIIPKHFDKLNPEPGPTGKARPDLQLCSRSQPKIFQNRKSFRDLNNVTLAELPSELNHCLFAM